MINIEERLQKIKTLVEQGGYFVINRAYEYRKTITLQELGNFIKKEYFVVRLDF